MCARQLVASAASFPTILHVTSFPLLLFPVSSLQLLFFYFLFIYFLSPSSSYCHLRVYCFYFVSYIAQTNKIVLVCSYNWLRVLQQKREATNVCANEHTKNSRIIMKSIRISNALKYDHVSVFYFFHFCMLIFIFILLCFAIIHIQTYQHILFPITDSNLYVRRFVCTFSFGYFIVSLCVQTGMQSVVWHR